MVKKLLVFLNGIFQKENINQSFIFICFHFRRLTGNVIPYFIVIQSISVKLSLENVCNIGFVFFIVYISDDFCNFYCHRALREARLQNAEDHCV